LFLKGSKMETPCDDADLDRRLLTFQKYLEHAGLTQNLYQVDGVRWCLRNELYPYIQNIRGGFLADEMGLGKTIMMIGLFLSNFRPRTLVVVPPALIQQWHSQILKTTGHNAIIFHGTNKKKISLDDLQNSTIVITTYGAILQNHTEKRRNILQDIIWGRIVFDEAHHLRNQSIKKKGVRDLLKTDVRWLVSGTPIQNSLKDLRNLCMVLGDFPRGLITKKNIPFVIKNYMLRRTKAGVGIDIPELSINNKVVEWKNENEKQMSEDIHSSIRFSNVRFNNNSILFEKWLPIVKMIKVRQLCIYPPLIKNLPEFYGTSYLSYDSKMDYIANFIVDRKNNGNGKIVFCHFRREIDHLALRLNDGGCRVALIDGRITLKQRDFILNDSYDVIILQIQTCCEGLNLQDKYSEVYFISPHWNPAVEDQAVARCHRIGQKKMVSVFKFIMSSQFVSKKLKILDDPEIVIDNRNINILEEEKEELPVIGIDDYITNTQTRKRLLASEFIGFASG
jgi:SNF2 family DNA or RNA helicase